MKRVEAAAASSKSVATLTDWRVVSLPCDAQAFGQGAFCLCFQEAEVPCDRTGRPQV